MERPQAISSNTRKHRSVHRWFAPSAFVVMTLMSTTGLLLGWKKHSNGWLMADNAKGVSSDMKQWLSMDSLDKLATSYLKDSIAVNLDPTKDRIEVRPDKGMVKAYTTMAALLLGGLTFTGAFLWINPKRIRQLKQKRN